MERLITRSIALIVTLLLVACKQPTDQQTAQDIALQKKRTQIGCAILEDFVTAEFDQTDRPLWLKDTPVPLDEISDIDEFIDDVWKENPDGPPKEKLRQEFEEYSQLAQLSPTAECPEIAEIKRKRSISEPHNQDEPEITDDGLYYMYDTIAVQVPFVDLQLGEAWFEIERVCGPMCAAGYLVIYRRNSEGDWSKNEEQMRWVS